MKFRKLLFPFTALVVLTALSCSNPVVEAENPLTLTDFEGKWVRHNESHNSFSVLNFSADGLVELIWFDYESGDQDIGVDDYSSIAGTIDGNVYRVSTSSETLTFTLEADHLVLVEQDGFGASEPMVYYKAVQSIDDLTGDYEGVSYKDLIPSGSEMQPFSISIGSFIDPLAQVAGSFTYGIGPNAIHGDFIGQFDPLTNSLNLPILSDGDIVISAVVEGQYDLFLFGEYNEVTFCLKKDTEPVQP